MADTDPFLLEDLRERIALAVGAPDDVVTGVLTDGFAHALDLESEVLSAARHVDEQIDRGDDVSIARAAARHRRLIEEVTALRAQLAELRATRRPRRAAVPPPPGRSPATS
jgi:hypothetical protein